jgi:hypothetical protein
VALPIGVGSGLMNTTPIVAMLVPAAKEREQSRGINARELLLPIAHITTLAGSVTLIGTGSNLLIAGIAAPAGIDMTMPSFAPVALPVAIVGAVIVYLTGPLMLRGQGETETVTRDWRVEIQRRASAVALSCLPGQQHRGSGRGAWRCQAPPAGRHPPSRRLPENGTPALPFVPPVV